MDVVWDNGLDDSTKKTRVHFPEMSSHSNSNSSCTEIFSLDAKRELSSSIQCEDYSVRLGRDCAPVHQKERKNIAPDEKGAEQRKR